MKKFFALICLILLSSNITYAAMGAYDAGSLNREYMRDMRLHEIQTRERKKVEAIQKEKQAEQKASEVPLVTLQVINFSGNEAIPTRVLYGLVSSNIGQNATEQNISAMRKTISRFYNNNGYYSAIVTPDLTNLPNGQLTFQIKENERNSITIEK